jgi:YtkA-like
VNLRALTAVSRPMLIVPLIVSLIILALFVGCKPPDPNALNVKLETTIPPSGIGKTSFAFSLEHEGQPLTGATVGVENMMTHPGMVPVTRPAQEIGGGKYQAQGLEFAMAGDYVVTVTAKKDGRIFTGEIRFGVQP